MPKNSPVRYATVLILLHWLSAGLVFTLFALGLYMVDLTYYDPWYRTAPALHKGIGVVVFLLMLVRLVTRWRYGAPALGGTGWQKRAAKVAHIALYVLLIAVPISGYFISTADGRPLEVFGWFEIPALVSSVDNLEDIAGAVHQFLTYTLMAIVLAHTLAALKHHFITKDNTLRSMLGITVRSQT